MAGTKGQGTTQPAADQTASAQDMLDSIDGLKSTAGYAADDQMLDVLAKLESAEKQTQELLAQLDRERAEKAELQATLADNLSRQRLAKGAPLTMPTGNYKFRVGPMKPEQYDNKLPTVEVETVDESEARRWYCANFEWPVGSGRAVDPVHVPITCTCIDNRRAMAIALENSLGVIRQKVAANATLNDKEQELLDKFTDRIFGVATGV